MQPTPTKPCSCGGWLQSKSRSSNNVQPRQPDLSRRCSCLLNDYSSNSNISSNACITARVVMVVAVAAAVVVMVVLVLVAVVEEVVVVVLMVLIGVLVAIVNDRSNGNMSIGNYRKNGSNGYNGSVCSSCSRYAIHHFHLCPHPTHRIHK